MLMFVTICYVALIVAGVLWAQDEKAEFVPTPNTGETTRLDERDLY